MPPLSLLNVINGCIVLLKATVREDTERPIVIVLCDRGEKYRNDRYVTAQWWPGCDGWNLGHYITKAHEAVSDWQQRCTRGY